MNNYLEVDVKDVKRFNCEEDRSCEYEVSAVMQPDQNGSYVLAADYDAALSKLVAETLRADTAEAELTDMQHWRDLALQFDNHRMNAMFHLKTLVSDGAHYDAARNFLSEQPLSAHEVVEKLAAAEQRVSELEITMSNAVEWFDDGVGRSDAEFDILQRMRATLNPQTRGRKS